VRPLSRRPVREFPSYKGQQHLSCRWWTATTGALVGYESWLERGTQIVLDFDPAGNGDCLAVVLAVLDR
jgi:hypothetical protein